MKKSTRKQVKASTQDALHRMLHFSKKEQIPDKFLEKIMTMKLGIGAAFMYRGYIIPVTPLLQERVKTELTRRRG